jgi:hypothetical protein
MKTEKTHKIQYIQAYAVQTFQVSPVDILYQLQIKGNNEVKKLHK